MTRTFLPRPIVLVAAAAAALTFLTAQPARGEAVRPATRPQDDAKVGQMTTAFAADLYARLAEREGNLSFSPASVHAALAMAAAGARGRTADEMARTLHLDPAAGGGGRDGTHERLGAFLSGLNADGRAGGYELTVANALWAHRAYPLSPDYVSLVRKHYGGNLRHADFAAEPDAARRAINDWVATETRDRVTDLMPPTSVTPDTRLVLANAVYFKGRWDVPFAKGGTAEADFAAAGGKAVRVPLMHQQAHFRYAEDDEVQVLELPYGRDGLAMRVFLPKRADGLAGFERRLTARRLADLTDRLRREDVRVWLPRFTAEGTVGLADVLRAMGMRAAFGAGADFGGLTSAERVEISAVVHRAFVRVDEEGTEAAAATAVAIAPTAAPRGPVVQPKEFRADHPFVFTVVHRGSGATLFMGRLARP